MLHRRSSITAALGAIAFVAVGLAALRAADEWWASWLGYLTIGLLLAAVLLAAVQTGTRRAFWVGFALFGWGYLSLAQIPAAPPRRSITRALEALLQTNLFFVRTHGVRIIVDADRMRAYSLSADKVRQALTPTGMVPSPSARHNRSDIDLMIVVEDKAVSTAAPSPAPNPAPPSVKSLYLRIPRARSARLEQYGNIILKANPEGEILRIQDVATVEMGSAFNAPHDAASAEDFIQIGHTLVTLLVAWLGGVLGRRVGYFMGTPKGRTKAEARERPVS